MRVERVESEGVEDEGVERERIESERISSEVVESERVERERVGQKISKNRKVCGVCGIGKQIAKFARLNPRPYEITATSCQNMSELARLSRETL